MKTNGSLILGVAMTFLCVLMEIFWIQTGSSILGGFSVLLMLAASGALARTVRLDYASGNPALRKFLTTVGMEN